MSRGQLLEIFYCSQLLHHVYVMNMTWILVYKYILEYVGILVVVGRSMYILEKVGTLVKLGTSGCKIITALCLWHQNIRVMTKDSELQNNYKVHKHKVHSVFNCGTTLYFLLSLKRETQINESSIISNCRIWQTFSFRT